MSILKTVVTSSDLYINLIVAAFSYLLGTLKNPFKAYKALREKRRIKLFAMIQNAYVLEIDPSEYVMREDTNVFRSEYWFNLTNKSKLDLKVNHVQFKVSAAREIDAWTEPLSFELPSGATRQLHYPRNLIPTTCRIIKDQLPNDTSGGLRVRFEIRIQSTFKKNLVNSLLAKELYMRVIIS